MTDREAGSCETLDAVKSWEMNGLSCGSVLAEDEVMAATDL